MLSNTTFSRFFSQCSTLSNSKNLLSKLRKKTGFSFVNCKKALQLHENDIKKAEEWLKTEAQKQGWDKATKLQGRPTVQGLIGILGNKHAGVMIELNCETDFVARNSKFQDLVANVAHCCHNYVKNHKVEQDCLVKRWDLSSDDVKSLTWNEEKTVSDLLALNIGNLGENMKINRAACMKVGENHPGTHIFHYTHGESTGDRHLPYACSVGKYGSLMAFKKLNQPDILPEGRTVAELGRQLCQHIVGMNPRIIGDQEKDRQNDDKDEEDVMIYQEFLLDPDYTVGDILNQTGVGIIDYVRYECGESVATE